ncbi:MAG: MCP four helix bundle domain-containing protein [Synergistales bacterium]|nr:MCP four helix bundle domain-containing protein [Synergistales bacterium]
MKIRGKLLTAFLIVAGICGAVGWTGLNGIQSVNDSLKEIGRVHLPAVEYAMISAQDVSSVKAAQGVLLDVSTGREERERQLGHIKKMLPEIEDYLERYRGLPRTDIEDEAILADLDSALADWKSGVLEFVQKAEEFNEHDILDPVRFRGTLNEILKSHYLWVLQLNQTVNREIPFKGELDPTQCALGKWIQTFKSTNDRVNELIEAIHPYHKALHNSAQKINEALAESDRSGSQSHEEMQRILEEETYPALEEVRAILGEMEETANHLYAEYLSIQQANAGNSENLQAVSGLLRKLVDINEAAATHEVEQGEQTARRAERNALIGVIAGVLLAVVLGLLIARMIARPLNSVVAAAERAKGGDLTIGKEDLHVTTSDELGAMANSLLAMIAAQRELVRGVKRESDETVSRSESLAALSEETNASMEEVKSSIDEVAKLSESNSSELQQANAGIEEVASNAQDTAKSSADGAESSRETNKKAEEAITRVEATIADIESVSSTSQENREKIGRLVDSVDNIAGFVSTITSIADQTNLLALNAAIEAARAGEAGQGFAVVAEEVRKLAEESNRAAREVSDLIERLQSEAKESIATTEESVNILGSTVERAQGARKQLNAAMEEIRKIDGLMQSIASAAQEQAASSQEMASSVDQVAKATNEVVQTVETIRNAADETAQASESVATEAQEVSAAADRMQQLLERFRVETGSGLKPAE